MPKNLFQKAGDVFKKTFHYFKKHQKVILTVIFVGIIAIGPFGFQTAHADVCNWAVVNEVCGAVGTVAADLLMIPMILMGWLLWLSGVLLNFVLDFTVVHMAVNLDKTTGINIAWSVIRDLANISFIFVLLYAAIKTILGEGGDMKKTITGVVMAAVLLNFSLLFTKLIVDASNILTITFYSQIVKPNQGDPSQNTYSGLSNTIMQPLGLTTLYDPTVGKDLYTKLGSSLSKVAIVSIGSSVFMFAVAGVFFAMSGMFIVRYISIMLLLVLSPVWILGSWLPQLKKYSGQWVSRLSAEVTFAPVFMIMMWAVIVIINSSSFACVGAKNNMATLFTQVGSSLSTGSTGAVTGTCTTGPFGLIMNFTIALVLVGATITIAKSTAGHASTVAQTVTNGFAGLAAGGIGYAGRKSAGRIGNKFADNKYLTNKAVNGGIITRNLSRGILSTAKTAQKSKFDTSPIFKQMGIKADNPLTGIKVGNFGKQKTISEIGVDKKKTDDEYKANLSKLVVKERSKENEKKVLAGVEASKDVAVLEAARLAINEEAAGKGTATDEQKEMVNAVDGMEMAVGKMSDKEIEAIVEGNKKLLESMTFSQTISTKQLEALNKSDKLDEQEKAKLKDNRFSEVNSIRAEGGTAVSTNAVKRIQGLGIKEIEMLPPETLKNEDFVNNLKQSQVDDIMKNDSFSSSVKAEIRTKRNTGFEAKVKEAPKIIKNKNTSIKQIANLETNTLTRADVLDELSIATLSRLGNEITDQEKISEIRKSILGVMAPAGSNVKKLQDWLNSDKGKELYS